jgi:hypothetical protein
VGARARRAAPAPQPRLRLARRGARAVGAEGRSGAAATFASGTSTFIPDAARHALPHAGLVAQLPVASAFYQPIHRAARVAGVIALAWKRPRVALPRATRTALEVADAASMALGRTEADGTPRFTR